jgi:hypothetical protein
MCLLVWGAEGCAPRCGGCRSSLSHNAWWGEKSTQSLQLSGCPLTAPQQTAAGITGHVNFQAHGLHEVVCIGHQHATLPHRFLSAF